MAEVRIKDISGNAASLDDADEFVVDSTANGTQRLTWGELKTAIGASYNVVDFGADSTGAADSSTEIQAAIDAAFTAGGGTVFFPKGRFLINSTIDLKFGVSLIGPTASDPGGVSEARYGEEAYQHSTAIITAGAGVTKMVTCLGTGATIPHFSTQLVRTHTDGNYANPGSLDQYSTIQNLFFHGNEDNNRAEGTIGVFAKSIVDLTIKDCGFNRLSSYAVWLRDCAVVMMINVHAGYTDRGILLDDVVDSVFNHIVLGNSFGPSIWLNTPGSWRNQFVACQVWGTGDNGVSSNEIVATLNVPVDTQTFTWAGPATTAKHQLHTGDPVFLRDNGLTVSALTTTHYRFKANPVPTIVDGGSGYAGSTGQRSILTLDSGTANVKALVKVNGVDGSGAITSLSILNDAATGDYTATPASATTTTTTIAATGSGAILDTSGSQVEAFVPDEDEILYAIRIDDTSFKLARGYDQAMAGQAITFSGSSNGTLYVYNGKAAGFYLSQGSKENTFGTCRADYAALDGVLLEGSDHNTFTGTLLAANTGAGVNITRGSVGNSITGPIISEQDYGVIFASGVSDNTVIGLRGNYNTAAVLHTGSDNREIDSPDWWARSSGVNVTFEYAMALSAAGSPTGDAILRRFGVGRLGTDGNLQVGGSVNSGAIDTIADGDTTPSVTGKWHLKTANTSPTTITGFDEQLTGQQIIVIFGDSNTTIKFTNAGLFGNDGVDWTATQGDHMTGVYDGSAWYFAISSNTV